MSELIDFLSSLGLDAYAARFIENEIDVSLLSELTDQDLKELGMGLIGHRRKLMRAVAERRNGGAVAAQSAVAAEPRGEASRPPGAERRHLTVMFCDLVGSTALAARLDPEDVREVVRAYQGACAQVIGRYEGFLAQYLGDGIMAYFGYPQAHEDDAERAVRAGLDLVAAVGKLDVKTKVEVRIGVATGLVVVGDLIGEHAAKERAVTGETPNLAARLQGLAAPGAIVVGAATRRLLGGMFDLHDLGPQQLKGLDAPVQAFAVEGVRSFESRFEARSGGLTGFVGREEEGEHLLDRKKLAWQQGRGQVVIVSGEAGIGKSRLSAWLVDKIGAEPHMRLRYQCTPHHKDSALYPAIAQLDRVAGVEPNEAAESKLGKLEAVLSLAKLDAAETVPLFAALLAIPIGERYPPLGMSPGQQRQRTMAAMLDQIEGLAKQKPLLMIYEDAHWADATSLELLDSLVDRIARLPVFCVVTGRAEFSPAWAGRHNVSTLVLQKLDRRHAREMVESVTGGAVLPAEVMDQIIAKTDGVPLFVEELTKTVLDSGALVEEGRSLRATGALPIPATLQDSLMARLDRSNPVKEIAQIGAAIGREFSYTLLVAVAGMDEASMTSALAKLEESELATRRGIPPDATYTFKHALVQDAAYESLLKSRRQVIHRRIAKALRDKSPVVAEIEPEIVAHHFTQAALYWQAAVWWARAGEFSRRRGAYVESLGHYGRSVRFADEVNLGQDQLQARLGIQIAYRNALISIRGWAASETIAAYARSSELAEQIGGQEERIAGRFGLWLATAMRGDATEALQLAEALRREVLEREYDLERYTADYVLGQSKWACGDFAGALASFRAALATYERQNHLMWFGADGVTMNLCYSATCLWPLGRIDEARSTLDRAYAHAQGIQSFASITYCKAWSCVLDGFRADRDALAQSGRDLLETSEKHDLKFWSIMGRFFINMSCKGHDNIQETIHASDECIFQLERINMYALEGLRNALRADLRIITDPKGGLDLIDATLAKNSVTGQSYFDAELHRRKGNLLRQDGQIGTEAAFLDALAVARNQNARTFELRASLDLARLYCDTGREREARDLLAPALVGFAETPELPESGEARRLLVSLG